MAARSFVQLLGAPDPGVVVLAFNFTPNGTGAIASSAIRGRGVASVSWNGTDNVYDVVLADEYPSCLAAQATYVIASPDDKIAQVRAVFATAKTIGVSIYDISTGTRGSVSTGTIHVTLVLKNSGV
jgi:hypothetical protein